MRLEKMSFKNLRLINMKYLNNLLDKVNKWWYIMCDWHIVKEDRLLINKLIEAY